MQHKFSDYDNWKLFLLKRRSSLIIKQSDWLTIKISFDLIISLIHHRYLTWHNLHADYPTTFLNFTGKMFTLLHKRARFDFPSSPSNPFEINRNSKRFSLVAPQIKALFNLTPHSETQQVLSTRCLAKKSLASCEIVSFLYRFRKKNVRWLRSAWCFVMTNTCRADEASDRVSTADCEIGGASHKHVLIDCEFSRFVLIAKGMQVLKLRVKVI